MYDVIISGAGPSGSQCAETIAKAGYKVALLEKDVNHRKPCGGGLPSTTIYEYYPQLRDLNAPAKSGLAMYSADFHKIEYVSKNKEDYPLVVDRLELDNMMRDAAVEAGAELFDKNLSIDFITENGKKIGVKAKTPSGIKEYRGKIIIVADGMGSKLAAKSGLRDRWKTEQLGLGKAVILEGENTLDENFVYFFFRPCLGYGWIFPITKERFDIGVITYYEDNLKYNREKFYENFLNQPVIKEFLPASNYKEIWSGSYPEPVTGVLPKSLYGDNIMMIGDNAGFVSPVSGEGILPSVISGRAAGEVAIEALKEGDYTAKTLKKYKLHPKVKKYVRKFKMMRSMVDFFFEEKGRNLNIAFRLAEEDIEFRKKVIDTFIHGKTPPKEFIARIKAEQ